MTIFSIIFFIPSPHFPHSRSFHTQINIFVKSYYAKMRIAVGSSALQKTIIVAPCGIIMEAE